MSDRAVEASLVRAFRMAQRAFPRDFRDRHGREMGEAFERALRRRLGASGPAAAARFGLAAVVDAVRQGWTERTRSGPPDGHGRPERGGPSGHERGGVMRGWATDLRIAARALRRSPGFTAAAVAVLALGIGANTTVFSALRAAILASPPYPELDRLVLADLTLSRNGEPPEIMPWSYPKFRVLAEADDRLVDPLAGYALRSVTLTEAGPPTRIGVELVSPGYFGILGLTPALGREFGPSESDPGDPPLVAMLSHDLWRGRFGADAGVLGRTIVLNGDAVTVVGVAPPGFSGLTGGAEVWIPMAAAGEVVSAFMTRGAQAHWMRVVGRLRADATFEAAQAWMEGLGRAVAEAHPSGESYEEYGGTARLFEDVRVNENGRAAVLLLSVAAGLVLLVACANLSGLLLARTRARARDTAVRRAVGASRWRLVRASFVESGLLAGLGGGLGLVLSVWGTSVVAAAWPQDFLGSADGEMRVMSLDALGLDLPVLAFGLAATAVTMLLFGIAPAVRGASTDLSARLKEGAGASRRADRVAGVDLRALLVGGQVALAVVLLVGAGLVGVSMKRLLDVDPGFEPEGLLTVQFSLARGSAWSDDPVAFQDAFLERVAALPGVEGAVMGVPPYGGHWSVTLVQDVEGRPPVPPGEGERIGINIVTPGYFEVLGIPLLQGRTLDETDGLDAAPSVVLNRTAAVRLFPEGDAVGRRIELGITDEGKERLVTVVGVVGDARYTPPDEPLIPEAYYAAREFPLTASSLTVRVAGSDPSALVPAIRAALQELDPPTPLFGIRTMTERRAEATGDRRVVLWLLSVFAAVTLLLAATGTWGIVSYAVADRRRELGLRMALGAGRGRVVGTVLRASVAAGVAGLGVGLAMAWAGGRMLDAFLFETSARDPWAFAGGGALLLAVVALASYVPARRATTVDPVEALKAE
ncbi:MAG: ABC transporter permease [Longimicrobiales bacterium]